jgi:hypothetical protein
LPGNPAVITGGPDGTVVVAGRGGVARLTNGDFELIPGSERFDVKDAFVSSDGQIVAAGAYMPQACEDDSDCCPDSNKGCLYNCIYSACVGNSGLEDVDLACADVNACLEGDLCTMQALSNNVCAPGAQVWRFDGASWHHELDTVSGTVQGLVGTKADSYWLIYEGYSRPPNTDSLNLLYHSAEGWSAPVAPSPFPGGNVSGVRLEGAWTIGESAVLVEAHDYYSIAGGFVRAFEGVTQLEDISAGLNEWAYHYQVGRGSSSSEILRFEFIYSTSDRTTPDAPPVVKRRSSAGWTTEDWSMREVRLPIIGNEGSSLVSLHGRKAFSKLQGNAWTSIAIPSDLSFVGGDTFNDPNLFVHTPYAWSDGTRAFAVVSDSSSGGNSSAVVECNFE